MPPNTKVCYATKENSTKPEILIQARRRGVQSHKPFSEISIRPPGTSTSTRHPVSAVGSPRLTTDNTRLLWVWFYRLWPRCPDTMVLVKPATVVQWHRQGFRLFWRWRSRSGRPSVDREIRKLIREMNTANPLWGAPRIHGELLKLGIEISQASVAKYMVRRRGMPSPTWRSLLRNQVAGIAAIDMFVVASASFRLLYVMVILAYDRRKIVRFDVTRNPTAGWLSRQVTEAFLWDTAPRYLLRDRNASYSQDFRQQVDAMGITEVVSAERSPWQNAYVERVIGPNRRASVSGFREAQLAAGRRSSFVVTRPWYVELPDSGSDLIAEVCDGAA